MAGILIKTTFRHFPSPGPLSSNDSFDEQTHPRWPGVRPEKLERTGGTDCAQSVAEDVVVAAIAAALPLSLLTAGRSLLHDKQEGISLLHASASTHEEAEDVVNASRAC